MLEKKHIVNKVLKGWIAPWKTFRAALQEGYKTSIFYKHIQVLNALMYILYRERDATMLWTSQVPTMEEIVDQGPIFNWGEIIS